ncbi:MAG: Asp-tRNA(Asn)/Glu-tRNA(Gln) amidotransferase subunit GatA [Candidatus Pacebacteria bacterium]|nr:Asp-tRNA(Asn)/Glu-tRNA(Gln) amidotransferase subunit GatA [Candidatus Paceibacterota bacterium]
MKLNELTIDQAQEGLFRGDFSSVELVRACLARIKKADSRIKAFITVCEKKALNQAREADQQLRKGIKKRLLGIPVAFKDLFVTEGIKTTAGSQVLADFIPQYDATVVRRFKEAGAIVVGKTNLDAWGHGSSGENSAFGATRNPWNQEYVPGGSSSGSGAALAAGMCLAATGTDTGSSIRLPASFCNLVGMKNTYGRVSRFGVIAMASSFDCPGCLTKTVKDQAAILEIISGQDGADATMPDQKVPDYSRILSQETGSLKIGLPKEYFNRGIDNEVGDLVKKAIRKIIDLSGGEIIPVSLPHTKYAMPCYYILVPSEISSNLARYDGIRYGRGRDKFGDEAKRRIMLGTYALSAGYYDAFYLKAQKIRTLIKRDFEKVFSKVDVIMAPTSPTLPFKLGEKTNDPLAMYLSDILVCPVNIAGIPALNLPVGFSKNGLPVGMQIIGSQFSEEKLLRIGYTYEQATEWYKIKPKI